MSLPLQPCRLLITAGSGSGSTTLGGAIARAWAVPHADVDDYYWEPTSPPFRQKRDPAERLHLMRQIFLPRTAWVLSGSLMGWGDDLMPAFDAVILLTLDPKLRMARLEEREAMRMDELVRAGTASREHYDTFMTWARGYDDPDFSGRTRAQHEQWLARLSCPVLRLDGSRPVEDLVESVLR